MSSIAEDYFCNLNPLAKRIGEDIKTTKDAYEELWNNLSLMEKNQAIDETIIQPEVALKYSNLSSVEFSKDLQEFYPKLKIQTGLKYILDETGSVNFYLIYYIEVYSHFIHIISFVYSFF